MIKTLIIKEIQNQLTNLRFIIGLALSILVTLTATVILTHDYDQQRDDYYRRVSMQDEFLNHYAHVNRINPLMTPHKPPVSMRPLVTGIAEDTDLGSFDDNPLPLLFPTLDLVFIVTIILSLLAILLGYDALCGEREAGTLKLILANHVKRSHLLVGKWIGGLITLLIPFLLSILMSAIYLILHPSVSWDGQSWLTLLLLVTGSMTFLSVFFLLSLWISTLVRTSAVSILSSLFVWVILVLAIPNLSPYLAAQCFKIPSVNRVHQEIRQLTGIDRDNLGRSLRAELNKKYENDYPEFWTAFSNMGQDALRARLDADPAFQSQYTEYRAASQNVWAEANRIQGGKAEQLRRHLDEKAGRQTWAAKHIACLSPYANYIYLATDLTGTGLRESQYFSHLARQYYQTFHNYLQLKESAVKHSDPTYHSNAFIDLSDRPRFSYQEESLGARLVAVLPYWGLLFFFNALFFLLALTAFIRYDIR